MSTTSKLAMNRKIVPMNALGTVALAIVLCGVCQSQAQGPKTPYPSMAPIEQYLMDRNAEIALARSAAPESISRDAEVSVLGRHGYETAVKGKNGFVCVVERSWMFPFDDLPGSPVMLNPQFQGAPEPVTVFMIPVLKWSDGTAAPRRNKSCGRAS
jgi:hypothetical protein